MNHPSDDALNNAWNHLAAGNDPGASPGIDPVDATLLGALHNAAAGVAPDPAFRDQLWADLSRRPAISAPSPVTTPSRPAPVDHRTGEIAMTPRLAPTGRRWSPPIATIAAALVIVLIGYGALSLSGANPSGLNLSLNEVPNASAQGQGQEMVMSDNPVVGTWAWLADFSGGPFNIEGPSNFPIAIAMTLNAGGGVTATAVGDWTGHGTWSLNGDSISLQFTVLASQEALKRQGYVLSIPPEYGQTNYVPNILVWSMSFRLTDDGNQWENVSLDIEMGVQPTSFEVGSDNPGFFVLSDFVSGDQPSDDPPLVRRLDNVIESAPTISAQEAGLESADPEASTPPAQVTVTPIPTTLLPTPTVYLEAQATVYVKATMTAESALPTETPLAQLNPTEQVTVTPIATVAP